jgi:hypothetical protein
LDSAYFAMLTFTTIGHDEYYYYYANTTTDTDTATDTTASATMYARILTCVSALSGVVCFAIALGMLGNHWIGVHDQERVRAQTEQGHQVMCLFDKNNKQKQNKHATESSQVSPSGYSTLEEGRRRGMYDYLEDDDDDNNSGNNTTSSPDNNCCSCACSARFIRITVLLVLFCGMLYAISQCEQWDIATTIYYGIITGTYMRKQIRTE